MGQSHSGCLSRTGGFELCLLRGECTVGVENIGATLVSTPSFNVSPFSGGRRSRSRSGSLHSSLRLREGSFQTKDGSEPLIRAVVTASMDGTTSTLSNVHLDMTPTCSSLACQALTPLPATLSIFAMSCALDTFDTDPEGLQSIVNLLSLAPSLTELRLNLLPDANPGTFAVTLDAHLPVILNAIKSPLHTFDISMTSKLLDSSVLKVLEDMLKTTSGLSRLGCLRVPSRNFVCEARWKPLRATLTERTIDMEISVQDPSDDDD